MTLENRAQVTASSPAPLPDEWFENQEKQLIASSQQLGREIASHSGWFETLKPSLQTQRAQAELELVVNQGALLEIRELRRTLLGLGHNAHIRGRALPNFVADNPDYAKVVADEIPLELSDGQSRAQFISDPSLKAIEKDQRSRAHSEQPR